ncbi:hypothetical protein HMSSN036_08260 [Paenibacillus macerans]|uniref:Mersacidin/lichenicidin family type 2 lantibiotic n=1 Tax=Paenibacillus macerans TaxID=44252 RepID=A0A090YDD8_PAEMA|nr:mersacidin/lichenicidin family type 2 lantibiotic [Paenibacillus macerans]KFM95877.1 type 2 lantibiotic, mersacidin/lichenicidin family protein [Paenibacillus macerans]MBS5912622.1 mersacidin/lichenicidin family type 2 lantibiotic [Paenibacillus macerans]MCY7560525.1 mersacidin/lichenicidin family type 2 lantibiotic [Paenibacillus macerans]MDU7476861.1 mersacidin/lichenicidin family type 2 lantibiotic [Paenibacillus macerans]MEC0140699.1 mersacidin/lichenicidin family type 2 lantibiotic [Pa
MTTQDLVKAWKNPNFRSADVVHPAGDALVEVGAEELARVHGGLVEPQATPTITIPITIISGLFCFPTTVH